MAWAGHEIQCFKNCRADDRLYVLVRNMEGLSTTTYRDSVGVSTICFGHAIKKGEAFKEPLTGEECQAILENDLAETEKQVNALTNVKLYASQHDALVDFVFNVGAGTFKKSTLLKRVNAGDHNAVPAEFLRYIYAGGEKSYGLDLRRHLEVRLYPQDAQ